MPEASSHRPDRQRTVTKNSNLYSDAEVGLILALSAIISPCFHFKYSHTLVIFTQVLILPPTAAMLNLRFQYKPTYVGQNQDRNFDFFKFCSQ